MDQIHRKLRIWSHLLKKSLRILTEKKTPSNETLVLTKSTSVGIWAAGTTNQLFIRSS